VSALEVTAVAGGARFGVHVQPRASRTELAGVHGSALKVRLHAPPVDGAANEALLEFLSERLGVPKRSVSIVTGHASRTKTVQVEGISVASIQALAEGEVSE
jgi:uncharacterized protein (TIGR00251 family)